MEEILKENLNVILTILGLFIAAASTIVEKLAPEDRRGTRAVLVLFALVGFGVTAWVTILQNRDDSDQKQQIGTLMDNSGSSLTKDLDSKLDQIDADLRAMAPTGEARRTIVPLQTAPSPSQSAQNAQQYFVQIAADTTPENLNVFAARLQRTYNVSSDFAGVVNVHSGAVPYRLAFGEHLDNATAEKYKTIANKLGLPPPGQFASVQPQPQ